MLLMIAAVHADSVDQIRSAFGPLARGARPLDHVFDKKDKNKLTKWVVTIVCGAIIIMMILGNVL